ncbi:glycosyltransferase [Streptomyces sp. S.PNR 29]|uniref:glycosyltransferase n=1 Tax=Streptomyces sp. S.PNR 29 TaxID=2973805 RepID=UPI0025AF78D0|nr:glycosyltransferase [Streptomyces sp. S.PNR 29]MDN0198680.1 glycosyltransferase [Streptomyces sp. S.PNR 29]
MKALIYACHGFRGDVQPYLALAYALESAGHSAVLAAPRRFTGLAEQYGIRFVSLTDELLGLYARADVQETLLYSDAPRREDQELRMALLQEVMPRFFPDLLAEIWAVARDEEPDIIVYSHVWRQAVHQIAERLGVPHVLAALYPHFLPSRHYPAGDGLSAHPSNLADHEEAIRNPLDPLTTEMVSTWRANTLGLPPREGWLDYRCSADGTPTPVLHGFSPHELPPAPDWPTWAHVTGFWTLPAHEGWQPSSQLLEFLAAGKTPIAVGFGSMTRPDTENVGRMVQVAVQETNNRAVIVTGWGGIEITEPSEDILVVDEVPYDWLFPRVRAAVHAGGIGTHNAALVVGIPQVTVPFHAEQLMWSEHLHTLGVAPRPIKQRELTGENLADAIRQATTDSGIVQNAARFAEMVRPEDGCAKAVRLLEEIQRCAGSASGQPVR